ncbi:hypothetical protein TrRE_jg11870 [Triparma retinervis]|uniref:BEACH domain-containing protein n=1 Tax=Triparma retinervis TaxID=2557542 RepID=A0A9W7FZ74_9STRA|nr:hypothetical protein TrRE_jg11870 [Triparma retinervis]
MNLTLGNSTVTGKRIHDVELPKWTKGGKEFVRVMRKGLESHHVGREINKWIDLVFGVNSRGGGARNSDNLFAESAYYETKDLEIERDESVRDRMIMEAEERH